MEYGDHEQRANCSCEETTAISSWGPDASAGWLANVDFREGVLESFGDVLLDAARLDAGQRVLEVGSGAGALARQIASLVGHTGEVVGVDISPELTGLAAQRSVGYGNLSFFCADAQAVVLPERSFDRVISRFGVMFFTDAMVALRHLHSLLRSGGSFHAAVWDDVKLNPWADLVVGVCRRYLELPPRRAQPTGAFAFSDASFFGHLLRAAGFREIESKSCRYEIKVGGATQSMQEVARALLPPGLITRMYTQLQPLAQAALIGDIADELARFRSADGVQMFAASHIVSALA